MVEQRTHNSNGRFWLVSAGFGGRRKVLNTWEEPVFHHRLVLA